MQKTTGNLWRRNLDLTKFSKLTRGVEQGEGEGEREERIRDEIHLERGRLKASNVCIPKSMAEKQN